MSISKNTYDLEAWVRSSWTLLVEKVINPSKQAKNKDDKGIKNSIEQLVAHLEIADPKFKMSRMTLYNILKYNRDTNRRPKQATIDKLNGFFREAGLGNIPEWKAWSPEPFIVESYIPMELVEPNKGYYYQCDSCFKTWIDECKNHCEHESVTLKTYSITLDISKRMSPGSNNQVKISLCSTCESEHGAILSQPWNELIKFTYELTELNFSEFASKLETPLSTLHRYANDFNDCKYINKNTALNLLNCFFTHYRVLKRHALNKILITNTLREQYGLVEGKPYYNALENNSATDKVILYPTVYGQRNAMACFLVTELSFTKQQFEHFVVKAKELEASYLCLINISNERTIENRNSVACNLNKSNVNNTFRIEEFNLACYDIGRYPYSKCDIPQGPSALFLRKLGDKEKFRSLDEAIDKYIKTEKAKLENVHYKQSVIDWFLKTKFIVSKLFDEGSSDFQNLFYESLHSTLSNKLHAHPSTEMFVGVIVDFKDASRDLAKFETQNIQLINIDNIILEKLRFISKSQFCLEALSLTSFIERDLALLSDAFVQISQDNNFFALTQRMTGHIETIKNEDQKTIFKLAAFVELQQLFEMINQ